MIFLQLILWPIAINTPMAISHTISCRNITSEAHDILFIDVNNTHYALMKPCSQLIKELLKELLYFLALDQWASIVSIGLHSTDLADPRGENQPFTISYLIWF